MPDLSRVFKAYDVRGVVPDEIDEDLARRVGAAFVRLLSAKRVVTAHDMRESSPHLARAFAEGATGQGADVVEAGLGSTDLLYFASGRLDVPGAMFTASHNPAKYNGIKLCRAGAAPVGQERACRTSARWSSGACPRTTARPGRSSPVTCSASTPSTCAAWCRAWPGCVGCGSSRTRATAWPD